MTWRIPAASERLLGRIRMSPRERGLVALLAALGCLHWAVASFESAQQAGDTAADARAMRLATERMVRQRGSRAFHQAVAREFARMQQWSLRDPTIEIARLRGEGDLVRMARESGVTGVRIVPGGDTQPAPPVQPLLVAIEGEFAWGAFRQLLRRLAAAPYRMMPVGMEVEAASPLFLPQRSAGLQPSGRAPGADKRFRLTVELAYLPAGGAR